MGWWVDFHLRVTVLKKCNAWTAHCYSSAARGPKRLGVIKNSQKPSAMYKNMRILTADVYGFLTFHR
jgi:hypothetical protein